MEDMKEIRHDLERVRILLELIKKRERAKKALVDSISAFFELTSDPITHNLTYALDLLQRYAHDLYSFWLFSRMRPY